MCGLAGILGNGINQWDLEVLDGLLWVSALRGQDSTGIMKGKTSSWGKLKVDYAIRKMGQNIGYFRWFMKYHKDGDSKFMTDIHANSYLGHVRAATKGVVNDSNAHPFDTPNLVGMHNGTLRDDKYQHQTMTDSELMLNEISERGLKATLEDLAHDSAYALVLFDKNTGEVTFTRNSYRTLYYCLHATRSVLYYASEPWMLRAIMGREREEIFENQVYMFLPDKAYTINPDKLPYGKDKAKLWKIEDFNLKQAPVSAVNWGVKQNNTPLLPAPPMGKLSTEETNDITKEETKSEDGKKSKVTLHSCAGCQKELHPVDVWFGDRLSDNTILCVECAENLDNQISDKMEEKIYAVH